LDALDDGVVKLKPNEDEPIFFMWDSPATFAIFA
jgi:hypothetical protein